MNGCLVVKKRKKRQMKNGMLLLLLGVVLTACHSRREMTVRQQAEVVSFPVESDQERVRDTAVAEEVAEPAKAEAVVKTHGDELLHYCVIVGSFVNEQNAVNLRNSLMRQGFSGTSVMRNDQGMYRVSDGCDDSWRDAWSEVCRIRNRYPEFRDAWLLEVKSE